MRLGLGVHEANVLFKALATTLMCCIELHNHDNNIIPIILCIKSASSLQESLRTMTIIIFIMIMQTCK